MDERARRSRARARRARALKPGIGRHDAHVRGGRLGDDRGDAVAVLGERRAHRVEVVVGQHESRAGDGGGHAGRAGQRERREPGARLGEQAVGVAVVVPGELHDHVAAGEPARQADGASWSPRCRSTRGGAARPGATRALDDVSARSVSRGRRRAERQAAAAASVHRLDDLGVRRGRAARDPTTRRGRRTRGPRRR